MFAGVVVPLGKVEEPTEYVYKYAGIQHAEFIIPKEEQVCIKYLIQLRQN